MSSTETDTPQNFDEVHDERTEVLTAFDRWLQINHSALLTRQSYGRSVGFFWDFLSLYHGKPIAKKDVVAVTMTDMRAFLAHRSENKASHATNAQSLSGLKTFYRFLIQQGHTLSWSLHRLRRPRLPRTLPRPLDQSQLDPLMAPPLPQHASWIEWRNYSAMVLLYATGLRIQEVLNINLGDWGKPDGISVVCKGDKPGITAFCPWFKRPLTSICLKIHGPAKGQKRPCFWVKRVGACKPVFCKKHCAPSELLMVCPNVLRPTVFDTALHP